ncbi:hypothetical protein Tco_1453702, partial [Tanacetum coccineum]
NQASPHNHDGHDYEDLIWLVMLPLLRAGAGGCRKWDFWAKMGSKLLNSCEPARPADTNASPKVRLCTYLFAADLMTNTQAPPTATIVVNATGAPVTNTVANHAEKPEKFNGQNFKRWQQKMFFYLTTLGLARFLKETAPQVEPPAEGQSSNAQAVQDVEALKHSDFLCHNYVLNGLIDPLYIEKTKQLHMWKLILFHTLLMIKGTC